MSEESKDESFDFGVVVLTYHSDFNELCASLITIFKQKNVRCKVIITDDGSGVDYWDRVKTFLAANCPFPFVFVLNPKNQGTVLNYLSSRTAAESCHYIFSLSPGDYFYDDEVLKKLFDCLNENQADFLLGRAVFYHQRAIINSNYPVDRSVYRNPRYYRRLLLVHQDFMLGAALAFRRELFYDYLSLVSNRVKFCEDFVTFLYAINNKSLCCLDQPVVWYEYDVGISAPSQADSRMKKDQEGLRQLILHSSFCHFPSFYKMVWRISGIQSPMLRHVLLFVVCPSRIFHFLRARKYSKKTAPSVDISAMDKMISLSR